MMNNTAITVFIKIFKDIYYTTVICGKKNFFNKIKKKGVNNAKGSFRLW